MKSFDCLSQETSIFGPHLLEASAGTGKTFSIEHVYVRLILEGVKVEQILAITFTRAATRELKDRIRSNLGKAFLATRQTKAEWDYLNLYLHQPESLKRLEEAISAFDRCQIFTIHGFCYRMLKEFAFEARVGALIDPEIQISETLKKACIDFLRDGIDENLLCIEQIASICKEFDSEQELVKRLLRLERVDSKPSFSEKFDQCKAALQLWPNIEEEKLLEDFRALEPNFKAGIKGDFVLQVKALANLHQKESFRQLIKEKASLFDFLKPERKKVRSQEVQLHYPGFFEWARLHVAPLIKEKVFPVLQFAWNQIAEKILQEEEHLDPDEILRKMRRALEVQKFKELVQEKYVAGIIDEFQDTDALQWTIFQKLFFEKTYQALYLVGDPKQSIYRFRKADVYTYLKARDLIGEENLYQLDTNYRSSKSLLSALNALFHRNWIFLPKTNRFLPYHPVKAGAKIDSDYADEKGAIHFFIAEGDSKLLFEEVFLPAAVKEIQKLDSKTCAILVKDRYQSQKAFTFLKDHGISAHCKGHTALGKTIAFEAITELFEALFSPRDKNLAKVVMAGPFQEVDLLDLRAVLEEKGLAAFAKKLSLDADGMKIFELLFAWEQKEGFSFEGLRRYLRVLKELEPEEGGARPVEVNEEAVQIMTLHISKGLEFDVVFALGLASRTPEAEEIEEMQAEKLRTAYVAMTRAKRRLYLPIVLSKKEASAGTHSPMELFLNHFSGAHEEIIELAQSESITFEHLTKPIHLEKIPSNQIEKKVPVPLFSRPFTPFFLNSFTTLAKTKEFELKEVEEIRDEWAIQTMPRGAETGILIHSIFEEVFSSKQPIWRDIRKIEPLILKKLQHSFLEPWQKAICQMVDQTLKLPLMDQFSLYTLEPKDLQVETEFIYSSDKLNLIKGFIDLVFRHQEKIYLVDWKSNWLENYTKPELEKEMKRHDYALQAAIYQEALQRHFKLEFGGAFYVFIRGNQFIKVEKFD